MNPLFLWDSKFVFVVRAGGCAHFLQVTKLGYRILQCPINCTRSPQDRFKRKRVRQTEN